MDVAAIFATIERGLAVANALGGDSAPVLKVIGNLVTGAKDGTVTDEQLAETEAMLDQLITEFNQPI